MSRLITHIVVHCTATPQGITAASLMAGWAKRGWKNPGYHIVIFPDGKEHRFAPDEAITNGVAGHNRHSLHVSYIGGVMPKKGIVSLGWEAVDNRTDAQKRALINRLSAWKLLYPNAKILGHRDFSPDLNKNGKIDSFEWIKQCPCFDAIPEYSHL